MKRALWVFGGIFGVLVVGVVAVGIYVLTSLDSLVQRAIETYGSAATRSEVAVGSVDVDLFSGHGTLREIRVGNPPGFSTPTALKMGAAEFQIDTQTVTSDVIVIPTVVIDAPEVTYEIGGNETNIEALQRNVEAYAGGPSSGAPEPVQPQTGSPPTGSAPTNSPEAEDAGPADDDSAEKSQGERSQADGGASGGPGEQAGQPSATAPKLIIDNLYIRNGTVNVAVTAFRGSSLSAPLADIHLRNIGRDSGGATPEEVAKQVLNAVLSQANKAAAAIGGGITLDNVQDLLRNWTGAGEDAAREAGDALKKLLE